MQSVHYEVVAARPGELDIHFWLNDGAPVIDRIFTVQWDGQGSFERFIHQHVPYEQLRLLAAGNPLAVHVGNQGNFEVPIAEPYSGS